jgi:acylphosphatase
MTMTTKTLISLSKANGQGLHNIALNYDDATVEAITQAALDLLHMHRMAEGDTLSVTTIEVKE